MSEIAREYHRAVHAATQGSVDAEEEAQLTTPVSNLFTALVREANLGELALVRETRTASTRPDFAALLTNDRRTQQKGYIELKAPSISVDTSTWRGRNARQWEKMSEEADILIVCNGEQAQLYRGGISNGPPADLPYDDPANWDPAPLTDLLGRFIDLRPAPITSIAELTRRLAIRTRDLRDRIEWLVEEVGGDEQREARGSLAAWRAHIYPDASRRDFADGVAQVIAYGMVLAALTPGDPDTDGDGYVNVREAREAIRDMSPVLAAAFAPLLDKPVLRDATRIEVGGLETLISAIDRERIASTPDSRGDAWLRFYEDFLWVYDPDERREAGVYYTPVDAVSAMTAMTGHLLVERLGMRMGFGDAAVVTLDPATGTGTFPLAAMERAINRAPGVRGQGGIQQAARNLARNMYAFELLPGPYAVAHLRLSQELSRLSGGRTHAQVVLTDTLEAPDERPISSSDLFGDPQILAEEQERANRIKREQNVTVVMGNPPYRRVAKDVRGRGSGGWVLEGVVEGRGTEKSLFDDILDVAKANTIFSHHASLYNLYVYFWRWSLWKAFEAHGDGPGVVTLITGSSWLHGPGFVGLRQLVRELADEVWVLDLGGDNKGANPEENIFAIETPVAIVTLVRDGTTDRETPAKVNYLRIRGTEHEKLAALRTIGEVDDPFAQDWADVPSGWLTPLLPPTGDAQWEDMPNLSDIFPWQQPGCMHSRTWPIAPSIGTLERRWDRFRRSDPKDRPELYVTPANGRSVVTKVGRLKPLIEVDSSDIPEPIVRFAVRSFDRQWSFHDPRLAKTDSPSLWQSSGPRQIYLASLLTHPLGSGPSMTAATGVPDKHFFRGSYGGKDIIPLYRDSAANEPNVTKGLPAKLGTLLGIDPPSIEDIACYTYGLLSAVAFQQRFAAALERPGLRVPITADRELWNEVVLAGRELLWLHTFAERFADSSEDRPSRVPSVDGIAWERSVETMPEDNSDIAFDEETETITIGDGQVGGVRPEVWEFSVSGMQIVPKWLGYRTLKGAGRATSSTSALDHIRPTEWHDGWNDELLDLLSVLTITIERQDELADLLERVCTGELISAEDLPQPSAEQRKPPKTILP